MPRPGRLRVLALIEATFVTGPVKNLLQFARLAAEPNDRGLSLDISLATFDRNPDRPSDFVKAVRDAGIPLYALHEARRFDTAPLRQLRHIVDELKPDVVQSHNVKSSFIFRLTRLHRQYPWIAFHHGYTTTDWKDKAYNRLDRWSLPAAHRVICVCEPFARKIQKLGVEPSRIRIQHNSVKPFTAPAQHEVEALRRELGFGSGPMVLTAGRLSFEKGHADLLGSIALLKQEGLAAETRFVFAGDGPERTRLAQLTAELHIEDRVIFAGHRNDLAPFYALADLLALPSHSEGSPNVVLEAMAAGVPVAAASVGGVPEIVTDDETGLLAPARDIAGLAQAMRRLLGSESLRRKLAAAARERIRLHYTPEAYRDSMLAMYSEAIGTYPSPRQRI